MGREVREGEVVGGAAPGGGMQPVGKEVVL